MSQSVAGVKEVVQFIKYSVVAQTSTRKKEMCLRLGIAAFVMFDSSFDPLELAEGHIGRHINICVASFASFYAGESAHEDGGYG